MEIKKQLIDNMNESFDDKVADISDLVGEKGEVVRDRLKTLNFREYIELSKAVKQNDMEDARRILGLGIEEAEEYSDQQIKMAFGILNDPRYKQGNYSGAHAAIEKVAKGLASHPSVANALRRANESEEQIAEAEYEYDGKVAHISQDEFKKVHSDFKNDTPGEERMVILDPESGATISVPVKFMNEDEVQEYNTGGTMSPGEMRAQSAGAQQAQQQPGQEMNPQNKTKKAQAMMRLGKKNLGGATAQQAADALDKAGQGKALTPIQRKAMAQQAASVDQLAADPKTATQFRNLLNKLNNQGK
tara:strand:- start:7860 stop:8768 length:909 start_codon:yes stop_codon:yes gene_type:complete